MPQTAHIARSAPALLEDEALRTLLLGAVLLDTGNLKGQSVRKRIRRSLCDMRLHDVPSLSRVAAC